jgi:hypothetical protein
MNSNQAEVLTEGGDLREAQVAIPLAVNHYYVGSISGLFNREIN